MTNYNRDPDPIYIEMQNRQNRDKYKEEYGSLLNFLQSNPTIRFRFLEFEKILDFYKARLYELENI